MRRGLPSSFRLLPDTLEMLEGIAKLEGISQRSVVESLIRAEARRLGVKAGTSHQPQDTMTYPETPTFNRIIAEE